MAVKADANMAAMVRVNFQYQRSDQLGEIAMTETILFVIKSGLNSCFPMVIWLT